ncbi:MAG TPA: hypothetical protein DET40_24820 [Lentisphaeria bacterium]|nr:MAG: hypothetical protein A2X45_01185 [Lentisphaerae bacterium GWF2_50_93]HCE46784.1 hypothetical protein [Lentisphaeria bacterium]
MRTFLLLSGLLLCGGCMSTAQPPARQIEQQIVMPAAVAGSNIPEEDLDRVRYGEDLKAYTIGRYVDPNNSGIMYEKNVLYRVEESPQWNLRPNTEIRPPVGKSHRESPSLQKLFDTELKNEVDNQRRFSESLLAQTKRAVDAIEKSIAKSRQMEEQNSLILKKLGEQDKMIRNMEVKIKDYETERNIKNLKKEAEDE